jgi:predicted nucleic acid-binding protein
MTAVSTRACVLDADVVIAALDRADVHHAEAARALRQLLDDGTDLLLSTVNYGEVLVRPAADDRTLRTAVAAIDALGTRIVAPTAPMAREAARLRARGGISLPGGFALATARAHAAEVATFDRRVRRSLDASGLELAGPLRAG